MATQIFGTLSLEDFTNVIAGKTTSDAGTPPTVPQIVKQVTSPYADETFKKGPTNAPICSRGYAYQANTGINEANKRVVHVCNFPDVISMSIYKAGALGGQIIAAIRKGIKALLRALGISPSTSGFAAQLKKWAKEIKNALKFLNEINDFINGWLKFAKKIGDLIKFLLSLPEALAKYFADCLKQAIAALKAGYLSLIHI